MCTAAFVKQLLPCTVACGNVHCMWQCALHVAMCTACKVACDMWHVACGNVHCMQGGMWHVAMWHVAMCTACGNVHCMQGSGGMWHVACGMWQCALHARLGWHATPECATCHMPRATCPVPHALCHMPRASPKDAAPLLHWHLPPGGDRISTRAVGTKRHMPGAPHARSAGWCLLCCSQGRPRLVQLHGEHRLPLPSPPLGEAAPIRLATPIRVGMQLPAV